MTLLSWKSPKLIARTTAMAAILIAMQIVLSKLSIGPDNLVKFSFGFIATMLMGYYLGPWLTGVAMAISDILTNSVFSTGGNFFIGFTFSAIISGIIAGAFLYNQEITLRRLFIYEFVQTLVTNIFFTTLWIHIMYKAPIMALLTVRVPKNILTWIVYSIVGFLVLRAVSRLNLRSNNNTY